ncbi:MAG: serine hydrolase domain-containing protein, partial [Planctomycetota bacterium]
PVTLRGLLSHAAGTTVHGLQGYERGAPLPTLRQILAGRPPANSPPVRVEWEPNKEYRYSNLGYMVVQQLMEDVTGNGIEALLEETLLAPLGMDQSEFAPLPEDQWDRAARGHRADGKTLPGGWHVYPEKGATPFWSTPTDMAKFGAELMRSHQGRSERWLKRATTQTMLTTQPGGFGLGVALDDDGADRFYALHKGANEGYRTLLVLYPERGQGAVIMTNGDGGDALAQELLRSLSREYGWVPGLTLEIWMVVALVGGAAVLFAGLLFGLRARRRRAGR